jgi:hypothetical protein
VLELLVATGLRNLEPAVLLEPADHLPAVHYGMPFCLENTHFVYTHQVRKNDLRGIPMIALYKGLQGSIFAGIAENGEP